MTSNNTGMSSVQTRLRFTAHLESKPARLARAAHFEPEDDRASAVVASVFYLDAYYLPTWGLEEPLLSRIREIRERCDTERGSYFVANLPHSLSFGYDVPDMWSDNPSNFLVRHERHEDVPIVVWILGRIWALKLVDDEGNPRSWVFVGVQTLESSEAKASVDVYNHYSNPTQDVKYALPNGVRFIGAGCWGKTHKSAKPALFSRVYDATVRMSKSEPKLDARTLKRGDLIVMEAHVRKWFDGPRNYQRAQDREHTLTYQLRNIYFLKSGTKDDLGPWDDRDDAMYYGF